MARNFAHFTFYFTTLFGITSIHIVADKLFAQVYSPHVGLRQPTTRNQPLDTLYLLDKTTRAVTTWHSNADAAQKHKSNCNLMQSKIAMYASLFCVVKRLASFWV